MLASSLKFYLGISPALAILALGFSILFAQTQDPHAERFAQWIESAPPGIQRLIDVGQVRFETNDQELAAHKKQGLTKFNFHYDYRYRLTKVNRIESNPAVLSVTANIQLAEIGWTHRVVLMKSYQPAEPWKSRLLQHEFDHVSISTDPRLKILAKECLGARIEFELPSVPTTDTSPENQPPAPLATRMERQIQSLMEKRAKEIERITQLLNDRFDRESKDGVQSIGARESFFSDFFTPDTLRKLDFEFPKLLDPYTSACRRAPWKEHYLLNSPY
ncbi:MAG: hypothetical protein LW720_09865 [Pirellula sp.]|jgi:hypothetical protein|nr:hypothetical protein [Pirellula sp.]